MVHEQPIVHKKPAAAAESAAFRALEDVRPLYILPSDPLAEEVLIPGFRAGERVDCMVGFFSSEVLATLAPGLATYIAGSKNSFRLIVSPLLRPEDQAAIEDGLKSAEDTAGAILKDLVVTEDMLRQHTLKCLSWLLRMGRIEIKVALMKNALFHPKVWMFKNGDDVIAAHGSSNVTYGGIRRNIEQIAISKSWQDPTQRYIVGKLCDQFFKLWENNEDSCMVIPLPEAIRQHILKTYNCDAPPSEDDFSNGVRFPITGTSATWAVARPHRASGTRVCENSISRTSALGG